MLKLYPCWRGGYKTWLGSENTGVGPGATGVSGQPRSAPAPHDVLVTTRVSCRDAGYQLINSHGLKCLS